MRGWLAAQVDTWAVGVLAYELLSGRPPFEVEDERETKQRIMTDSDIKFPAGEGQGTMDSAWGASLEPAAWWLPQLLLAASCFMACCVHSKPCSMHGWPCAAPVPALWLPAPLCDTPPVPHQLPLCVTPHQCLTSCPSV